MAKDLILDRTVSVEMYFEDTAWPSITVEGKVDTGADRCSIDETLAEHLGWKIVPLTGALKARATRTILDMAVYMINFY